MLYNDTAVRWIMNDFFLMTEQIELTIALKLGMLQKHALPNLSYEQFKEALVAIKWKSGMPTQLHDVIDDVLSCNEDEIVAFLAKKAVIDGHRKSLADFASMVGGNE